ncbi:virulence-associated E family protein [Sphingomonas radiodurans]|uniref:virulence-associated E family protein n=1 Tax=Sphingomonas radiodurans TaxID=2890321 RepID=UPI001E2938C4|nr:virulence-associated E family protein [Sphingomonas radiodurans]WBH15289.1 virulence-associated E family protein [Sphingomonas radiodurans]
MSKKQPITGWPDGPPPGSNRTPTTIANVQHMLLHEGISVRYNSIKKDLEITVPGEPGTLDNAANVRMSRIFSRGTKHGLSTRHLAEFVQVIGDDNAYNPVADWIGSKPWDKVDRLPDFLSTITTADDYPPSLKETLVSKWLLSAAAAGLAEPAFKARGVLVLQGRQGIGKTSWIKRLVSDEALRDEVVRLDHHMDWSNKDSLLGAVNNWIVELGELEGTLRRDLPPLKSFVTADVDKVRRPYERRESVYPRRTVFAATVNDASFLIDPTGNSRWWTLAVESLNYLHTIDMQQLFAQLAERIDKGATWWLTADEEARLEAWNARHRAASAIGEQVVEAIDSTKPVVFLSASDVLRCIGYKQPTNAQAKECGTALRELYGDPKKRDGTMKWPVQLREPAADTWVRKTEEPVLLHPDLPASQQNDVF